MIVAMSNVPYIVFALLALIVLTAVVGTNFAGETWYEELKAWQDGLAAVIAFAGLAVAALVGLEGVRNQAAANASEAQRAHTREQLTEALRTAATLSGEVNAVESTLDLIKRLLDMHYPDQETPVDAVKLSAIMVSAARYSYVLRAYEIAGDRIGLIGPAATELVARLYVELGSFKRTYLDYWPDNVAGLPAENLQMTCDNFSKAMVILIHRCGSLHDALKARIAELEAERDAL